MRDAELINTVNAHLRTLSVLSAYDVDEATVRVASASLRVLLVEDTLARGWRAAGLRGPITVKTWGITSTLSGHVVAYCGGGDILPGIPASVCFNATLGEISLNLKDFRQRTRIQIGAVEVSTTELVQYVANTLGGIHFDLEGKSVKSRKAAFDLLRQHDSESSFGLNVKVNGRDLLHHEILSIAQAVLRSPEVTKLRAWREVSFRL